MSDEIRALNASKTARYLNLFFIVDTVKLDKIDSAKDEIDQILFLVEKEFEGGFDRGLAHHLVGILEKMAPKLFEYFEKDNSTKALLVAYIVLRVCRFLKEKDLLKEVVNVSQIPEVKVAAEFYRLAKQGAKRTKKDIAEMAEGYFIKSYLDLRDYAHNVSVEHLNIEQLKDGSAAEQELRALCRSIGIEFDEFIKTIDNLQKVDHLKIKELDPSALQFMRYLTDKEDLGKKDENLAQLVGLYNIPQLAYEYVKYKNRQLPKAY